MIDAVATGSDAGLSMPLHTPSAADLTSHWSKALAWALDWRTATADLPDAAVTWQHRRVGPLTQELPTHLRLPTLDVVAAWAGADHVAQLAHARARWAILHDHFPHTATASTLRAILTWRDVDVELLITSTEWFAAHPDVDHTWTPRQVPVPGLQAKWLDAATRRTLIAKLLGVPTVSFRARPLQTRITYLDPDHIAAGGHRWDISTVEDVPHLAYRPEVILIVENRDTAFYFPPVIPRGIALLGNGDAVVNLVAPLTNLPGVQTIYWGDIDAAGLRIVSRLRTRGHPVATILMDSLIYETYEPFGTDLDENGRTLQAGDPTPPPELTDSEAHLYRLLTDPTTTTHRRIEQERIPLSSAVNALQAALDLPGGRDYSSVGGDEVRRQFTRREG